MIKREGQEDDEERGEDEGKYIDEDVSDWNLKM